MKNDGIDDYLEKLSPNWKENFPQLKNYFEEIHLLEDELLSNQRGDIYYVNDGIIGKYERKLPQRYILRNEIIIVSILHSNLQFKALQESHLWVISRQSLHRVVALYADIMPIYDNMVHQQQEALEFRLQLLEMPKSERMDFLRSKFASVIPHITRKELAQFLNISEEYLRRIF